jgi:tRNA(Ile)-lysidine synthase
VLMHLLARWVKTSHGAKWLRSVVSPDGTDVWLPGGLLRLRRPSLAARAGWLGQDVDRAGLLASRAVSGIVVLTVDHRLRATSAEEAAFVAEAATALGFPHHTLSWAHDPLPGDRQFSGLQARARDARYGLMCDAIEDEWWSYSAIAGVHFPRRAIVTAHHRGDQIETFFMHLKRGSGLDGLASIMPITQRYSAPTPERPYPVDFEICRPLLDIAPERLAATARLHALDWREDPSNADPRFERTRMRAEIVKLEALGFNSDNLHLSVRRLQRAREVVRHLEHRHLYGGPSGSAVAEFNGGLYGSIAIDAADLLRTGTMTASVREEMICRLLSRFISLYGGGHSTPRLSEIEDLVDSVRGAIISADSRVGGIEAGNPQPMEHFRVGRTLGGCRIDYVHHRDPNRRELRVWREYGRRGLGELQLVPGDCGWWDGRFSVAVSADAPEPITVRALGGKGWAGLRRRIPVLDRLRGVPPGAMATLPAFWVGERLASVPFFERLPASVPSWLRQGIERDWSASAGSEYGRYSAHFQPGALP